MTDKQIIIKNCPCYYTGHRLFNCIVDDFGYRCEENKDCPIKKTFTITKYKNLFDIEEIEQ